MDFSYGRAQILGHSFANHLQTFKIESIHPEIGKVYRMIHQVGVRVMLPCMYRCYIIVGDASIKIKESKRVFHCNSFGSIRFEWMWVVNA